MTQYLHMVEDIMVYKNDEDISKNFHKPAFKTKHKQLLAMVEELDPR